MKPWLPFLVSMLSVSVAAAEPPPPSNEVRDAAAALVEEQLITPLNRVQSKRKRFSRAAPVPTERRVRLPDELVQTDARGKQFLEFIVDERSAWSDEGTWHEATIRGCVYVGESQVFVQRGARFVPARGALGHQEEAVPHVCRAAAKDSAQLATATAGR